MLETAISYRAGEAPFDFAPREIRVIHPCSPVPIGAEGCYAVPSGRSDLKRLAYNQLLATNRRELVPLTRHS